MDVESVTMSVSRLTDGIDTLMDADLTRLSSTELTGLIVELEAARRRLAAIDHRLVTESRERSLDGEFARTSIADLLVTLLRISPGEAKARVARAGDLAPRRTLQGEVLPSLLPSTSAAVELGEVSEAHVDVITDCLERLSPTVATGVFAEVESTLVAAAQHEHPGRLRRTAALLLARVDPDGREPQEARLHRRRQLTLSRHPDGSGRLTGRLTVEGTAVWEAIIDALSAPAPHHNGGPDQAGYVGGVGLASYVGEVDRRSAAQRRHDALVEAGQRLLRSGSLPPTGGVPVTVLVRTTSAELRSGSGVALTSRDELWPVGDLLASSSDAELVPVVTTAGGRVLHLGRRRRLANRAQRLALAARDGGCCFPGCTRPAAWTEVHHVVAWQDGGDTDIDNLCLLCRFHHRQFEASRWQVRIRDGLPEWTPPRFIDPARTPRRNHAHHPPDIDFDVGRIPAA